MDPAPAARPDVSRSGSSPSAVRCQTIGRSALYLNSTDAAPLLEGGRPLALLAYLALAPRHRSPRDHLAELLWPGTDLSDARHSLRQVVYRIRHITSNESIIASDGANLTLNGSMEVDVLEAERLGAAGEKAQASQLLGGDFLAGLEIEGAQEFAHWVESQRARFRELRRQTGLASAEELLAAGRAEEAVKCAEELSAAFPFDDTVMHSLMTGLLALAQGSAAIVRFRAYSELLKRELGQEPGDELRRLAAYIETSASPGTGSSKDLPFVGRSGPWSALSAAWNELAAGTGAFILIEGAAGLGKTRLEEEFTRLHADGASAILRAKCTEVGLTVPYGAVGDLLSGLIDRPELGGLGPAWLAEAARLLPELQDRFTQLPVNRESAGSQAAKRRLHQALARCVDVVAEEVPVVLIVDDIHWSDGPSLEVLHLLSQRTSRSRILLIASYRPAELTPIARQFIRALVAERRARLLILEPLTEADLGALVDQMGRFARPDLRDQVRRLLYRQSDGNPLFLVELLEALRASGTLVARDGRWEAAGDPTLGNLPQTLSKLLSDRLDRLEPWMRACVDLIAVGDQQMSVEVLSKALNLSEPRIELALGVLTAGRLVKRSSPGAVELIHDEMRRLVYQGIPDDRRRMLHLAVGVALEVLGEGKRPGGAARLARHFDAGGDRERTHRHALAAAEEARELAAPEMRKSQLELAESHAPKALPPRMRGDRGRPGRPTLRRTLVAAIALIVLTAASVAVLFRPIPIPAGYRQGTIYLANSGNIWATSRIVWGSGEHAGKVEALKPADRATGRKVFTANVSFEGETHAKLFLATGPDSVQLTSGKSDDHVIQWSPDGRRLLVGRGLESPRGNYAVNFFALDTVGDAIAQLTDTRQQDHAAAWSPDGTRLAVMRDSAGIYTLWSGDADGSHLEDLTARFRLPNSPAFFSYSPDSRRLAVLHAGDTPQPGILILDIESGTSHELPARPLGMRPLWSPDGRWIAYAAEDSGGVRLWVRLVSGEAEPVAAARLPPDMFPLRWAGAIPAYVEALRLIDHDITLGTGRGRSALAAVMGHDGRSMRPTVRWRITDTLVAVVDDRGFVRGRRPGATRLIGTVGGFIADTAHVTVRPAAMDTLLVEDWRSGLDTTRWRLFGYPLPVVTQGSRGPAFLSNGDYNHGSGAVSVRTFPWDEDGLTAEVDAWLPFTGQYHQLWTFALFGNPPEPASLEFGAGPNVIEIAGRSPTVLPSRATCGNGRMVIPMEPPVSWRRVTVQLRPDSTAECYMDGKLVGVTPIPASALGPAAVVLRGQSVAAELLHGQIVVTRGLKY